MEIRGSPRGAHGVLLCVPADIVTKEEHTSAKTAKNPSSMVAFNIDSNANLRFDHQEGYS